MAKKAEPAKDLTKPADQALAGLTLEKDEMDGMYGDMSSEHLTVPRLAILENMSPEINQGIGKVGEFFLKGHNLPLGKNPLEIVVLMRSHSRISWKPLDQGGGILCQAQDGKRGVGAPGGTCEVCPQRQWSGSTKPLCDLYENLIVVRREDLAMPEEATLMAISGSRTKLKELKNFNTMLMPLVQRRLPLFAKSFSLRIVEKSNPKVQNSTYRIFGFSPANDNQVLPEKEQQGAYSLFKSIVGKVSIQQDREEGGSAPAAPEGAPTY